MNDKLIVYGTLLSDQVVKELLDKVLPSRPVLLLNHRRCKIQKTDRGAVGPAVIHEPGQEVVARVLIGMTEEDFRRFDIFELAAEGYEREKSVEFRYLDTKGHPTDSAQVYRGTDSFGEFLRNEDWSFEAFLRNDLAWYLADRIPAIRSEHNF